MFSIRIRFPRPSFVVRGHRRTKDGVASLAYDRASMMTFPRAKSYGLNSLVFIMDCRVKPGNDSGERSPHRPITI
jgi:hypothetical protein